MITSPVGKNGGIPTCDLIEGNVSKLGCHHAHADYLMLPAGLVETLPVVLVGAMSTGGR
jgi:hypothetical protein